MKCVYPLLNIEVMKQAFVCEELCLLSCGPTSLVAIPSDLIIFLAGCPLIKEQIINFLNVKTPS